MKNILVIAFIIICGLNLSAQNSITVQIVLKTNDKIHGSMWIRKNFFDKKFIYSTSFNDKVKFYNRSGQKRKIRAREIIELTFTDLNGENRKFISKKEFKNHIVEVIYQNKIELYKHYYFDTFNRVENYSYYIFDHKGNKFSFGPYGNIKNKLKKMTEQNSDIMKYINNNEMNFENILTVIKMYEDII